MTIAVLKPNLWQLSKATAIVTVCGLLTLSIAHAQTGNTLNVPSEFSTPQLAVEQAQPGDTIALAPGTYRNVNLVVDKSITIQGTGDNAEQTVLVSDNGEDVIAILDGAQNVSITNLSLSGGDDGIEMQGNSSAEIIGVTISANAFGVFLSGSAALTVENSTISDNDSTGLLMRNSSTATLSQTVISNNNGRGISARDSSSLTIRDSTLERNRTIGIRLREDASAVISNNVIINNRANEEGSFGRGINLSGNAQATIEANTISGNQDIGIALGDDVVVTIRHNTINGNLSDGISMGFAADSTENAQVEISNNRITRNLGCGVFLGGNGGIDVTGSNNTIENNQPDLCGEVNRLPSRFRR